MTKDEIFTILKQEIMSILPVSESDIKPEKKLADIGANSIDRAEIVINCSKKLNVKISPSELADVKNIGDLWEALSKASN